jgi:hypothetical protein
MFFASPLKQTDTKLSFVVSAKRFKPHRFQSDAFEAALRFDLSAR